MFICYIDAILVVVGCGG